MTSETSGFIDLQINGCAGVDFNSDKLTIDQLHHACRTLSESGVNGILATIITGPVDAMQKRLKGVVKAREQDDLVRKIIWGFHIEGPFISPTAGFVGAHPVESVCRADPEIMLRLLDSANGLTRVVTLAPEYDSDFRVTRLLADQGLVVSAGHCDPSIDTLRRAIDAGLSMFTHLGNGCPANLNRHDNIIQRALSLSEHLWFSFITDGIHIPFFALGNYLQVAGVDRAIVVSDAISAAGLGPGTYQLGGQEIEVDGQGVTRVAGDDAHLAGSTVTMRKSAENLRDKVGLHQAAIDALTSGNARRLLASCGAGLP